MTYQYLVDDPQFPYCAGCGHTWINKALASALEKLQLKPTQVNLVTDIGCVGLVDKLFLTNTIHTTHGRSTAFASGLELADKVLYDGNAIHIIMIGDGGASLGIQHLIEAAKLNVNITVLLHNNFVYGMTGGQNSSFTPEDFRTATTMSGNLTPALHIANLLEASHASFISRKLATDKDLDDAIVEAIKHPGFALVETIELCTGYATKWNSMTKKDVEEILTKMDCGELGTVVKKERKTYSDIYKESFKKKEAEFKKNKIEKANSDQNYGLEIIFAGSAGEGVQFCSKTFTESSLRQGLNIMQKNDNPVTIGTGFSLAEIKLNSEEILYFEVDKPDYFLISSIDGLKRVWNLLNSDSKIIIDSSLIDELKRHPQYQDLKTESHDFRKLAPGSKDINFVILGLLYKLEANLDYDSLLENLKKNSKSLEKTIKAVEIGYKLS